MDDEQCAETYEKSFFDFYFSSYCENSSNIYFSDKDAQPRLPLGRTANGLRTQPQVSYAVATGEAGGNVGEQGGVGGFCPGIPVSKEVIQAYR